MRIFVAVSVMIIVMCSLCVYCPPAVAQTEGACRCSGELSPRITVTGTGKVTSKPDEAVITIGVSSEDRSLKRCFERQTESMNRVIEEVKRAGVKADDIKTAGYNIFPMVKSGQTWWGGAKPDSYKVAHTISVKVRDLSALGPIIDSVVASGANNINGLSFSSSRISEIEMEAKTRAVENAKAKAEAMAKGAGVKVGRVVEISDASAPVPVFRANTRMMAMSAESAAPQIEPGSLEVEGSCVLTAEITQ